MPPKRYLIVNADDFGLSPGVNRGIIQAHEQGIVTSASLMVRGPAAAAAAAYARAHPALGLGLHVDLGEWVFRDDDWVLAYEVAPLSDPTAVAAEVTRQLAAFRDLAGMEPTHLDSHQHVHGREPARAILGELAAALGVPLRQTRPAIRYAGNFYGQSTKGYPVPDAISVPGLLALLAGLPPGITELACHPGLDDDIETTYRHERAREVATLCDPQVRAAISAAGLILCSFRDVAPLLPPLPAPPR